jgi:hypothetical protein
MEADNVAHKALIPDATTLLSYAQEVESLTSFEARFSIDLAYAQDRGLVHKIFGRPDARAISGTECRAEASGYAKYAKKQKWVHRKMILA